MFDTPIQGCASRVLVLFAAIALCACTGNSGQRAAEGAGTGALAGAAGGLVSGLLWGSDPFESAARGAVVGATSGAVVGGVSGAKQDKVQAEAARQKEIDELRNQIGPDAYAGVTALAKCEHEVAEANARVAAKSTNSNYALAGLWVESISMADRGDTAGAKANDAEIIRWDRSVEDPTQVDNERQAALSQLQDIREEFKLPRTCT
jgi:hypothetical protein